MTTRLQLTLLFLALLSLPGFTRAQGTAIGYQGHLQDNGLPATGLYDFTFSVFDVVVDGAALAGTIPLDVVPVTNGLFNVSLDFGPDIFTGPARWLEITVRTNGVGAPELLSPRVALLPTPYSVFASRAASVANGTVTADQLNTGGVPAAPGQFLSYDGANFLWSDPGVAAGNIWSLNGINAYYNAGSVGIGTDSPAPGVRLEVNGPTRVTAGGSGGFLQIGTPGGETGLSVLGDNRFDLRFNGQTLALGTGPNAGPTPYQNGIVINTNGNVGIGMGSPFLASPWKLEINGPTRVTPGGGTGGAIQFSTPNGETGMSILGANRADVRFDDSTFKIVAGPGNGTPGNASGLAINTAGHVGMGTVAPQTKLHLYDPNVSVSHRIETGGGNNAWTRVEFANGNGQWHIGTSRGYNGDQFFIHRLGPTESPFSLDGNGFAARFTTADLYLGHTSRRGTPGRALVDFGTNLVVNFGDDWATTVIGGAVTEVKALRITGGADVAEPFHMPGTISKGSVVVIDEANPGHLKLSSEAYDTRVAGIVSGANGINPGLALHQEGALEGGQNVALSGRVYVHADATSGAIKPGDLLTTSAKPGYAMKVTDHTKAQGAILGKAMTALKEGKGMVLVLVTLQ